MLSKPYSGETENTDIPSFIALHRWCVFLQIEGKTLCQQKCYNFLYCDICFTAILNCGDLETNLHYLQGIPVFRLYSKEKLALL